MSTASIEEWQALSFFEVEPQLLDRESNVPWCYSEATYIVERNEQRLSFTLSPADCDVRIVLSCLGEQVYEYTASNTTDVRYASNDDVEVLEVIISEFERLALKTKPRITISHFRNG